ncbi:MAG: radical SAM protein [Methylocystaceae bacterium]|nr:radical SAM protein [Methylocystaceae bacterium]
MSKKSPLSEIYSKMNEGNSKEKLNNLPDFPRLIDVELTNTCNFRCLMCPTGTFSMKRKSGFMTEELFYKILDEVKEHKTPLRFIRFGEPTMHKQLVEFIRAATDAGSLTHINTNGSYLNEKMITELMDAGLSSLKFSFQGIDAKSFEEMRNTDFYNELVDIIRLTRDLRGEREQPFLQVSTSITYETLEQVQAFRKLMEGLVDQVSVGRTVMEHLDIESVRMRPKEVEMLKMLKAEESVVKKHPECPEVYDKLSINFDGTVTACCGDSDNLMLIGDLEESTISEIWKSKRLNKYRTMLADMRHDDLPLCKTCFDYQGLQTPGLQKI